MLTEPYVTIVDNVWYVRRDFDSKFHIVDEQDRENERLTGIPSYVGFQQVIEQPKTRAEILKLAESFLDKKWVTMKFIERLIHLSFRFMPNKDIPNSQE